MNLRALLIIFPFLMCFTAAEAGSAPASSSKVQGVLLGFLYEGMDGPEAYLDGGHSKAFIGRFKDACLKQKRIWALGIPSTFVCTKLEYIEEGGNGPVYELQLSTKGKRKFASHAVVFSLEPLLPHKPEARNLAASEVQGLLSVYKSNALKEVVRKATGPGAVQVLDFNKKSSSIYIIKWKHVESEFASNDHFLVINRNGEKYFSAGNFEGAIVGFVDVNNDGIPELQRSIGCDGRCEAITSIFKNTRDLVFIYNH